MLKQSGIYKITHFWTGKIYVGSAINIKNRWRIHNDDLRYSRHANPYLQGFYDKYGIESLKFEIIELCDKDELLEREQFWIDKLNSVVPNGCNILPIAGSRLGTKHSIETREKLKAARAKRITKDETRIKMSIARKGRIFSEKHREKLSMASKGKKKSKSHREAMSKAFRKDFSHLLQNEVKI